MKMLRKLLPHKGILDLSHHNTLFSQALSLIPGRVFCAAAWGGQFFNARHSQLLSVYTDSPSTS